MKLIKKDKLRLLVNKMNEKYTAKTKQDIIKGILTSVADELPDQLDSCILEVRNASTESVAFAVELVVNGEQRIELDDDMIYDMYVDVVAQEIYTDSEILELYNEFFYGNLMDEEDVRAYPYMFLSYIDGGTLILFLGGEEEEPMEFDCLNGLVTLKAFDDAIYVSVHEVFNEESDVIKQ
jgi:hypothetical protein